MIKFSLTPVDEVHLQDAPLAKVLMQVQYSRTPQLVSDTAEATIAEALGRYPVRRRQFTVTAFPSVVVNGQPVPLPGGATPGAVLEFSDPGRTWQAMITDTAVSLETSEYASREDFCDRAEELFRAISLVALPPVVDRVGLRYINRLVGEGLSRVSGFVIPQLQGLVSCVEEPLVVVHSITESQIEVAENERILVRSGLLAPGLSLDPSLPILSEPSWVLDMDAFTSQAGFAFDVDELGARLRRFAEVIYSFFRFATTEEFQDAHMGEPAPVAGG